MGLRRLQEVRPMQEALRAAESALEAFHAVRRVHDTKGGPMSGYWLCLGASFGCIQGVTIDYKIVNVNVFYRILSYRIVSYRIASHRIASHRIASHRIVSYRIGSDRIGSYRIGSDRIV